MKIASWRIVAGILVGSMVLSELFNLFNSDNPMFSLFYWHWVIGGFAFDCYFYGNRSSVRCNDKLR